MSDREAESSGPSKPDALETPLATPSLGFNGPIYLVAGFAGILIIILSVAAGFWQEDAPNLGIDNFTIRAIKDCFDPKDIQDEDVSGAGDKIQLCYDAQDADLALLDKLMRRKKFLDQIDTGRALLWIVIGITQLVSCYLQRS